MPAATLLAAALALSSPKTAWTTQRRDAMASKVREELRRTWNAYKKYAWGKDNLKPLSKRGENWYSESLLMTPVDALDTLILMGLKKEANEARELIATTLSFDKDMYVKNFEVSIRLLGGLMSGYQLTHDRRLLRLADDLGTRMLPMFDSPTGLPYVETNLHTGQVRGSETNTAEVGSYLFEFGVLSKLTGKPIYFQKAKTATLATFSRRSKIGLVATGIDNVTGEWRDHSSHLSGGIDSYYEYLLKCAILFGDADCQRMWDESFSAIKRYVEDSTPNGLWYGRVDQETGKRTATVFGSLDAFFPAVLVLAGDVDRARRLEDSCFAMWNLHGIEPEMIDYRMMAIRSPYYVLRPEIVESAYYLRFVTKDEKYLDMGQTFFDGLTKYCRTDEAYSALSNVVTMEKSDDMESFFLAETMKYLYLIFAPDRTLNLKSIVFNSEAHPIRKTWK